MLQIVERPIDDGLRLKAEEAIERLNQAIQEMMEEIDRLKTFERSSSVLFGLRAA